MRLIEEHPERVGYMLKERVFDVANLIDALRRLAEGDTVIDPTIVARLFARKRRANPLDKLTERERVVLALLAEGLSNRSIATRLFVTERTIEAHVKQVFLKIGLNTDPDSHRRLLAVLAYLRSAARASAHSPHQAQVDPSVQGRRSCPLPTEAGGILGGCSTESSDLDRPFCHP